MAPRLSQSSIPPATFADFPEDVQLYILSFLRHSDIASFAATSRRSASLCAQPKLGLSLCHRRWGDHTAIPSWAGGKLRGGDSVGVPFFSTLYKTLDRWERLIGFWRRVGQGSRAVSPPLVFFEWGPSFITASWVGPSMEAGRSYGVVKIPFLWMGVSHTGEPVSFLYTGRQFEPGDERLSPCDPELLRVTVNFVGESHLVVEENKSFCMDESGGGDLVASAGDCGQLMSEIYRHFANRINFGGEKASRRQRKRERLRLGTGRWDCVEHLVKIANCYPTPSRPLQGLWKGICEDMNLDFFHVTYDDIGGIACRRISTSLTAGYTPVFWTSNTSFLESPFPIEEEDIYNSREHIRPPQFNNGFCCLDMGDVRRVLCINSSYDLVSPDFPGSAVNLRNVEGRIWEYKSGAFGFGFLRNDFVIDLKRIASDGLLLLDVVEGSSTAASGS